MHVESLNEKATFNELKASRRLMGRLVHLVFSQTRRQTQNWKKAHCCRCCNTVNSNAMFFSCFSMCTRLACDLIDTVGHHALFVLHELRECHSTWFRMAMELHLLTIWNSCSLCRSEGRETMNFAWLSTSWWNALPDEVANEGKVSCSACFSLMLHAANWTMMTKMNHEFGISLLNCHRWLLVPVWCRWDSACTVSLCDDPMILTNFTRSAMKRCLRTVIASTTLGLSQLLHHWLQVIIPEFDTFKLSTWWKQPGRFVSLWLELCNGQFKSVALVSRQQWWLSHIFALCPDKDILTTSKESMDVFPRCAMLQSRSGLLHWIVSVSLSRCTNRNDPAEQMQKNRFLWMPLSQETRSHSWWPISCDSGMHVCKFGRPKKSKIQDKSCEPFCWVSENEHHHRNWLQPGGPCTAVLCWALAQSLTDQIQKASLSLGFMRSVSKTMLGGFRTVWKPRVSFCHQLHLLLCCWQFFTVLSALKWLQMCWWRNSKLNSKLAS